MATVSTITSSKTLQPAEVFPAGCVIELCGAAVLRTSEDLSSENCGELEEGQACLVISHGTAPDSRRLQVYVIGRGLRGWISCVAKSGRKLVTMIGAQGSAIALNAEAEAGVSFRARAPSQADQCRRSVISTASVISPAYETAMAAPAMTACGTMRSQMSGCGSAAFQPQSAMAAPAMTACGTMRSQMSGCGSAAFQPQSAMQSPAMSPYGTLGTMRSQTSRSSVAFQPQTVTSCQVELSEQPNYSQGNSSSSRPTPASSVLQEFPIGCCVSALDEMVMRAEEHLKSEQVAVLEEGGLLDVLAHGSEPGTRRLYVRQPESGLCGWISCVAQSGRPLVRVAAQAPPVAAVASNATRRSQMLSGASGVSVVFDPQEAEMERVRTVQTQRSAAGTMATTVATSYPAQMITEDPMPEKQWLRRQKAQDLREEAPKRFLVDNRLLNAGTDGLGYRFSKDLEDLDLSCTAPWGSVVEGVDEGSWIRVSDELYLPKALGGVTVLTLEDTPWALSGLQINEAFPIGSEVIVLEAAIMRAAEEIRSAALAQLEKDRRLQVLGYGSGIRSRRLYVQDPMSAQDGWISFASQTGKLLVAPTEATADEVQKVATMASRVAKPSDQFQELERSRPELEKAYFVDNREFQADSDGIGYRASADLDDKAIPPRTALWGSVVHGVDLGDGWCRVGAYYLPMTLTGVRVLTPKEEVPASLLPKLSGFARGDWEYICVDPQGVMTHLEPEEAESKPTGQAVQAGELIRICERGMLGQKLWLCLMDGRGWVTEKSSRRQVSEVNDEGSEVKGQKLIVDPRLDKKVKLAPAPLTFGSVAGAPELSAGMVVTILRKVQVLVPSPTDKKKEMWARYYKVEDERKIEGWLGELRMHCGFKGSDQGQPVLYEFKAGGFHHPDQQGRPCWVSVQSKSAVPLLLGPSRFRTSGKTLSCGDFLEAVEELQASGQSYYRLSDGSWVAREDASGKVACDLLVRESHKWVYVCNDKDGAQVRETPTRSNAKNRGKRIKYRQRVNISEKVTTSSNEVFLKLADEKKGWIPATKLGSSVVKMAPLQALDQKRPPMPMGAQPCGVPQACGAPNGYANGYAAYPPQQSYAQPGFGGCDPNYANGYGPPYMSAGGYGGCPDYGGPCMAPPAAPLSGGGDFGLGAPKY